MSGKKKDLIMNAWYNAGWDYMVGQGKDALIARQIANERVVLYRKPNGEVVALDDRCPHRQAALSLGRKEGETIRCMYHGMKFDSDGQCIEIPNQARIPTEACVRKYPVVERDNWIWVWMGDLDKVDESLIPDAVGYGDPLWNMKTSHLEINANYRLEIANLADLSHVSWTHAKTIAGSEHWSYVKPKFKILENGMGLNTTYWIRDVPPPALMQHLYPEGTLIDTHLNITHTLPCTWIMNFRIFAAGSAEAIEAGGEGQLLVDTWTCQAITPRDEDHLDYYMSWGAYKEHEFPGLSDLLVEILDIAFDEDKRTLEAQHIRMSEKPDFPMIDIVHDAGPGKMLWLLDKKLKEEANVEESLKQA